MKNLHAADALPVVRLKTERHSNHPWIFQKMVEKPEPKPRPGSVVDIEDRTGARGSVAASTTAIRASPCAC